MTSINSGRVVTAGLLSGLVMNLCDMTWNFTVMKDDMMAMAQKFGLDPNAAMTFTGALPFIVIDFLTGVLVVWTYAAMRPRFGPGPKAALLAGFALFAAVELVLYGFAQGLGMIPMSVFMKGTATGIVTMALGSLVGGWAYRE